VAASGGDDPNPIGYPNPLDIIIYWIILDYMYIYKYNPLLGIEDIYNPNPIIIYNFYSGSCILYENPPKSSVEFFFVQLRGLGSGGYVSGGSGGISIVG